MKRSLEKRFWDKVGNTDSCWLWIGRKSSKGYGRLRGYNSKDSYAHRIAYELFIGPIFEGRFVMHRCDVRSCVNPDHLFTGTHTDNMRDMHSKGRWCNAERMGAKNPSAKLSSNQVNTIRSRRKSGEPLQAIATSFGVTDGYVSEICSGKYWRRPE